MLSNHERVIRGNPPSLDYVGFSPLKSIGTYVDRGIVDFEGVVWRACIAVTNEKNLIRRNASEKPAEQKGQWNNMRCKPKNAHFKYLLFSGLWIYLIDHRHFIDT